MPEERLSMVGSPGSPYSRQLRAVLRYRRIPYAWVDQSWPEGATLPQPKVALLPRLMLKDESGTLHARVDTTPLIRDLERRYDRRSIIPPDPALALLDALLEDYADEWLTKCMFHYRWAFQADVANAADLLPRWSRSDRPDQQFAELGEMISKRQIERLWVVGSNEQTASLIEESYQRLLRLLDARLTESRFVLGNRPASADFGLYGQLTQLAHVDPTPAAIASAQAPRVKAWVDTVEDLSGMEPAEADWLSRDALPESLRALFAEAGRVYVPFLIANAEALRSGAERVECTIDGRSWVQRPFPYQGKCLGWLREAHAALGEADRGAVDRVLAGSGCERLFQT